MSLEDNLLAMLKSHEGRRLKPYYDTEGILTIGYGRNLNNGISLDEAEYLLRSDLNRSLTDAQAVAEDHAIEWERLSDARKAILADMAFNLGRDGLRTFERMLLAMARLHWEQAADEMLASRWATQVKGRALQLARMMRSGKFDQEDV